MQIIYTKQHENITLLQNLTWTAYEMSSYFTINTYYSYN